MNEKVKDGTTIGLLAGSLLFLVSFGGFLALAALRLPDPLGGDASLFVVAGRMLAGGASIYTDFWDVKQPGIFYFYEAAGAVFGFGFLGAQVFQLAYWTAVSLAMAWLLRPHLSHGWIGLLAPLACLGPYYAHAPNGFVGQVEILVSGPLVISALLLSAALKRPEEGHRVSLAIAGAAAAIVLVFKLALAPIVLGFLFTYALSAWRKARGSALAAPSVAGLLWVAAGGALVIAVEALHLLWQGSLVEALHTTFVVGPEWALYASEAPPGRLVIGALAFVAAYLSWLGFALIGALPVASRQQGNTLARFMLAWIALGIVCILIQRFSWWYYHWQLLYFPAGLLALIGLDAILTWLARRLDLGVGRRLLALVLLVLPAVGSYAPAAQDRAQAVLRHADEIAAGAFDAYRAEVSPAYREVLATATGLQPPLPGERVFVMGDPSLYVALGVTQAVAMNGWALEFYSPRNWQRLERELLDAPPDAIFVASYYAGLVDTNAPGFRDLTETRYRPGPSSDAGQWYILRK